MSKYSSVSFKVPDLEKSFKQGAYDYSDPSVKEANKKVLREINSKYGNLIRFWGSAFEIPPYVLIAFIATESGGKMLKPNRFQATGLMQVTPVAIWDCATKWNTEVDAPMPQEAVSEITKKSPELLRRGTLTNPIRLKLLALMEKDASYNIMAGCIVLRWLLDRFSTLLGGGQLNKAMVAYNAGAYTRALTTKGAKPITTPIDTTALATNKLVPVESRGYLYKMLGKDGFLSLLYQQKAI